MESSDMPGFLAGGQSSPEEYDDDEIPQSWLPQDQADPSQMSSMAGDSSAAQQQHQSSKPSAPMQKRRRVTRACDECRRKKIKCDGKQPCTHCTVYSYDCTYDQPSNRRRNPAPQYIEALENRLAKAETLLKTVLPDLDLSNPDFDAGVPQRMHTPARPQPNQQEDAGSTATAGLSKTESHGEGERDSLLESMVKTTGQLDLDDQGYWDYHGHSSGLAFLRRMREQFGDLMGPEPRNTLFMKPRSIGNVLDSPKSAADSPLDFITSHTADLPPKEIALELISNSLDDACAVLRFVHQPTFYALVDRVYDKPPDHYGDEEYKFLPLLYIVMAVGCLFARTKPNEPELAGYETLIDQGFAYFKACRQMIEITDCRDLTSIQAIIFMTMFLQSSAKLSTCYSYVGIALRSSLRMGLHRSVPSKFNPIEREIRKRVFWTVFKMDTYVGALLGLPKTLSQDDIDQDFPLEVDDDWITKDAILQMPAGHFSLHAAANAHTRILKILAKVIRYIYPIKGLEKDMQDRRSQSNVVSHARIRELERDLQEWMDNLPMQLRTGGEFPPKIARWATSPAPWFGTILTADRAQHLLRMAYAHVQMMLYRPFLHYVSQSANSHGIDKRSYACGAACVSVSRNIIHITSEMKKRNLLIGAYWFTMYTTFFAILSLVFFVLENPDNLGSPEILKDAVEGRDTLQSLAKRSMAADRCTATLVSVFDQLPERLEKGKTKLASTQKKRHAPSPNMPATQPARHSPDPSKLNRASPQSIQRASTFPTNMKQNYAKRASVPYDASRHANYDQSSLPRRTSHDVLTSPESSAAHTPQSTNGSNLQYGSSEQQSNPLSNDPTQPLGDADLADLSAVMFPSGDPFAYPNQPITTLENKHSGVGGLNIPSSTTGGLDSNNPSPMFMPQANYQNNSNMNNLPMYAQASQYYMPSQGQQHQQQQQQQQQQQRQQQQSASRMGGMPTTMDDNNNDDGSGVSGPDNAFLQQPWTGAVPAINFDDILGAGGDPWSNIMMEQNYRQ
ncbi:MAG: hypothetical protein M4579_005808 [Chaenotheca gracillima]|nr:MAG: hypothetical protein M4579_005808 [Chaenotheca gracillima]